MVREEIKNLIDTYWDALIERGIDARSVYLFGSQATGAFHNESDIDLMVVLPGTVSWNDDRKINGQLIGYDIDPRFEIWFIGEDDFQTLETPLVAYVRERGELIKAA